MAVLFVEKRTSPTKPKLASDGRSFGKQLAMWFNATHATGNQRLRLAAGGRIIPMQARSRTECEAKFIVLASRGAPRLQFDAAMLQFCIIFQSKGASICPAFRFRETFFRRSLASAVQRGVSPVDHSPARADKICMAKLYFYFASMNAGKSTVLLQSSFNYRERGMRTMLFTAGVDDRASTGIIASRIGLQAPAVPFDEGTDLAAMVAAEHAIATLHCVLVDEAQFLQPAQVWQLAHICDTMDIPVLTYGLRTDFLGQLFPGSAILLAIADVLSEIKAVCACGRKATMNLRIDGNGRAVSAGDQLEIGGNDRYVALCRRHFSAALAGAKVAAGGPS
jgi:thymidine kinase